MKIKTIIADKNFILDIDSVDFYDQCKAYIDDFKIPHYVVGVEHKDIEFERKLFFQENGIDWNQYVEKAKENGLAAEAPDNQFEALAILRNTSNCLVEDDILLIHGAAIAKDDHCYVFIAKSGVGKTTHIMNWLKKYPETIVVNGDKPFINTNTLVVYGSPWSGKENLNTNIGVKLSGLVFLERGLNNEIERVSFKEIFPLLLQQTYIPEDRELAIKATRLIGKLEDVPCFRLKCNMDEESAQVAHDALTGM